MSDKIAAGIGSLDKNGKRLQVGDIVRYMAGSKRDIPQEYRVTDKPYPDIFQLWDKYNHCWDNFFYVRIFEFEQWGEIIGSAKEEMPDA